jgi:hypothetical protein
MISPHSGWAARVIISHWQWLEFPDNPLIFRDSLIRARGGSRAALDARLSDGGLERIEEGSLRGMAKVFAVGENI